MDSLSLTWILLASLFVIAVITLWYEFLNLSGTFASFVVGSSILLFGGWRFFATILVFFVIAMIVTRVKSDYKRERSIVIWEGIRTWRNVVANGGVATFFAILEGIVPLELFVAGFLGAVSTSAADTLATEIGLLYPKSPRLLIDLRKSVPPGTSGAISPLGELAMVLSATMIGLVAWAVGLSDWSPYKLMLIVLASGIVGCAFDSLLGCTVQVVFRCKVCGKMAEVGEHCGRPAVYLKGKKPINNDIVNFLSTLVGCLIAIVLCLAL